MNPSPRTPFEDFYTQVAHLWDSDVARHLRSWFHDHPIYGPLFSLHEKTNSVRSEYGRRGPDTPWNKPFVPGGLSSSLNKISELEAEKRKLKEKLDKCKDDLSKANEKIDQHRASLAAAHETFQEQEMQINSDRATIERLRVRAAEEYVRTKQYSFAAGQYEQLVVLKGKEKKEKAKLKDHEGERKAEEVQLGYKFDCGKAYALDRQYGDAEKELRFVLGEMERLGIRKVERADTRDVQTQLCNVLRLQGNIEDAQVLLYHAASLHGLQNKNEADRTWALQNATSYAQLLVEQKDYETAMTLSKRIWRIRHRAAASKVEDLEAEVFKIVTMLEKRGQSMLVIDVLKMACDDQNGVPLSEQMLRYHAKLGMLFHDRGEPDRDDPKDFNRHDHVRAIPYLRQAWVGRQQLVPGIQQSTGWTLALLLVSRRQLLEAKNVLADLLCPTNGDATSQSVSKDQILALLAYVQLSMGDFSVAESNAATVFKHCGVKNVFTSVSSSAIDFSTCHHADILIRARSKQDSVEKFKAAKEVWTAIYKARIDIRAASKAQLKEHAAAGATFADKWKRSAVRRNKVPTGAKEIEKQVKEVQAMTG